MFSYIARHWRGELSLPQSYWVNGFLIGLPFNLYFRAIDAAFEENAPNSPSTYVFMVLVPLAAYLPLAVWQGVGIWRSASHPIAEGKPGWAGVARLVVLFNAAVLIFNAVTYGRLSYALVDAYLDERSAYSEITSHGSYVVFHGEITVSSADQLAKQLNAPGTNRLVINGSNGGFVQSALRLAKIIHDRKLFVVALGECDSTCTGLVAAGDMRAIAPDTIVGFHRGTMAGLNDVAEDWSQVEDYYRNAGMSGAFIDKVRAHAGPYDLYEPTLREMIENNFVTDIFVDVRNEYIPAQEWCAHRPAECDRTGRQNAHAPVPTKDTRSHM